MPTPFSYPINSESSSSSSSSSTARPHANASVRGVPFLGYGILRPFVRDQKGDFAAAGGATLVKACVGQVLGTMASSEFITGELPWAPEFGSLLHVLRHRQNDSVAQQLAKVYITDALARWEPRVKLTSVRFERRKSSSTLGGGEDVLFIHVVYDVITSNVPGNAVVLRDVTQTVQL